MKNYKVLFVDDEEDLLSVIRIMFEKSQYDIITLSSCEKALEYIRMHSNDIIYIFSDYIMPEMNGLEFRAKINELVADIPFSLITGFYDIKMAEEGMGLSVLSFIEKPVKLEVIEAHLESDGNKRKIFLAGEKEMALDFIEESFSMLQDIEAIIMSIEKDPDNTNLLNNYFRLLHTIKGTAACVGLKVISKFTHKYEDLIVKLQDRKLEFNEKVATVLLEGLDYLKFLYNEVREGNLNTNIDSGLKIFDFESYEKSDAIFCDKVVAKSPSPTVSESSVVQEEKIGISIDVLNKFMELSGELTVIRNTLLKSSVNLIQKYHGDSELEIMIESLDEMHKVSSIFQNQISEMRKVSLEVVFKPLKRVVRDSAKTLNKSIDFLIQGEELLVDTSIGKILSNSLVHMVRNSIDHGIELPGARVDAGKSAAGTIGLKTFYQGENIIVELSDDGNGLNKKRIKEKAIESKLYTETELELMSEQRIFSMIFDSGFSTAKVVSDISGRGVGMDMVRTSIESVGGKIFIESNEGKGTKFILTLPIPRSVLIIKSLMVRSREVIYSIPLDDVDELVRVDNSKESCMIHRVEGKMMLSIHDQLIPLVKIDDILKLDDLNDTDELKNIVIVTAEGHHFGIIVDEILDIEEIVVKKMSKHFLNVNHFLGVTFLGQGTLALILNLVAVAENFNININTQQDLNLSLNSEVLEVQEFMQFGLKKSNRYALPLSVVNRLEEFDSEKVEYTGSLALIRYRGDILPLIFIERVMGLCNSNQSLASYYGNSLKVIVVTCNSKKYGIVVSEILEIGTCTNTIDSRNVDRNEIMGTVFISDSTITVVDIEYIVGHFIEFEKEILCNLIDNENTDEHFIETKEAA